MDPQSAASPPASPAKPPPEEGETAGGKPDRLSSSSSSSKSRASSAECVFHVEVAAPLVAAAADVDDYAATGREAKPAGGEWTSWPEVPSPAVDEPCRSEGGMGLTEPPEAQMMATPTAAPADTGFNPNRIPASIFQAKPSSQAEWSITSNDSLFSIKGDGMSGDLSGLYSSSRTHFDYFYAEAMAGGGGEPEWKLPTLAEGAEGATPGSADSAGAKNAMAFRRHESGSAGSSGNFSFAFPILAETSTRKRDSAGGYYHLQKEYDQSAPPSDPAAAFKGMTTEEERRSRPGCGQCCGCCWLDCSWPSCCCCCCRRRQWRWQCCSSPSCCL